MENNDENPFDDFVYLLHHGSYEALETFFRRHPGAKDQWEDPLKLSKELKDTFMMLKRKDKASRVRPPEGLAEKTIESLRVAQSLIERGYSGKVSTYLAKKADSVSIEGRIEAFKYLRQKNIPEVHAAILASNIDYEVFDLGKAVVLYDHAKRLKKGILSEEDVDDIADSLFG